MSAAVSRSRTDERRLEWAKLAAGTAAIAWFQETNLCHFCATEQHGRRYLHEDDCPLVALNEVEVR